MNKNINNLPYPQAGVSLIELLVATAVGLFLVSGTIALVVNVQSGNTLVQDLNVQQENGRIALNIINEATVNAGHWAGLDRKLVKPDSGLAITAKGECNADWVFDTGNTSIVIDEDTGNGELVVGSALMVYDGSETITGTGFPLGCIANDDYVPNTDILVVRYADPKNLIPSDAVSDAENENRLIIRTMIEHPTIGNVATVFQGKDGVPSAIDTGDGIGSYNFWYRSDIYYLSKCCGDDTPALTRMSYLGDEFVTEVLVKDIEQLQFALASDTDGDFTADRYDNASTISTVGNGIGWDNVIGIGIDLVVRNDKKSTGYSDSNVYPLMGGYSYTVPDSLKKYRRKVHRQIVSVRNLVRI